MAISRAYSRLRGYPSPLPLQLLSSVPQAFLLLLVSSEISQPWGNEQSKELDRPWDKLAKVTT